MLEGELDEVLERSRYARRVERSTGDSEGAAGVTATAMAIDRERCWELSAS